VWQHAGDFRGASRVSTWIFGIAYRCALNCLRRSAARSRVTTGELEGQEGFTEDATRATEQQQLLDFGLARLPAEQRLVLVLAYRMEYSCAEIAAIIECPVNTVKTRMFHARRKLHQILSAAALPSGTTAPAGQLFPV
jgi:RNA polymerase sigma-70 factor (ECF subfamily)